MKNLNIVFKIIFFLIVIFLAKLTVHTFSNINWAANIFETDGKSPSVSLNIFLPVFIACYSLYIFTIYKYGKITFSTKSKTNQKLLYLSLFIISIFINMIIYYIVFYRLN